MNIKARAYLLALTLLIAMTHRPVRAQESSDPYKLQDGAKLLFTKDIQPILNAKCVACHACYDAPAQLDLRNAKGVQRGAIKLDPYSVRETPIESTVLAFNPKTIDDWRQRGFFSVTEGGKDSLLGKIIDLGYKNPFPDNSRIPDDVVLGSLNRTFRRVLYAPKLPEFDGFAKLHPKEGMPLAVAGLSPQEYAKLMKWLEDGAQSDEVPPQPTEIEKKKIAEWEAWLNAPDLKSRLIARYVYEHHNLFHIYFDKSGGDSSKIHFFRMVRSSTPPGKEVVPIYTHFPNSPIDSPFYYRLAVNDQVLTAKMHQLILDASGEKLERYKTIFAAEKWEVQELPGYTRTEATNPLKTFSGIPAKTRWKFLLADIRLHRGTIVWGPVCRGDLVLSSVQDVEWDFFENPDTSLYCNDAEYRAELDPYLAISDEPEDVVSLVVSSRDLIERRKEVLRKAVKRAKDGRGSRSRLDDIWKGEREGDTPLVITYRNDDNAFTAEPGVVVGDYPKTTWVLDLPILEHGMYQSVVNFDLFGSVYVWMANREGYGMTRRNAELNFLRFLPAEKRKAIYESWYLGRASKLRPEHALPDIGPEAELPAEIEFKTDDPKREFQEMLLQHVGYSRANNRLNMLQPGDKLDSVETALRSIVAAADEGGENWKKFKLNLPEATFLRIDSPGKDAAVYTITRDRDFTSKAYAGAEHLKLNFNEPKDKVTIFPGILTAYPNFIFRVDERDVPEFAATLVAADTPVKFTAVVERWGVRRTNPEFWPIFHSFTDYVRRSRPVEAAIFDVNRYINL
jgi:hypothetical protein